MHGLEYYSAIKKNEIMPFAATQMHLEMITLREIIQKRKTNTICHHYMWNPNHDTSELSYKAEADWQTRRAGVQLPRGQREGWAGSGLRGLHMQTTL